MASHVPRLTADIQQFLDDNKKSAIPLSEVVKHITDLGYNMGDREMFSDWMHATFHDRRINHGK